MCRSETKHYVNLDLLTSVLIRSLLNHHNEALLLPVFDSLSVITDQVAEQISGLNGKIVVIYGRICKRNVVTNPINVQLKSNNCQIREGKKTAVL